MVSTVVLCCCLGLLFVSSSSAFTLVISSADITHAQFSGVRIPTPVVDSIDPGWIPPVENNNNNNLDGKSWCKTRRHKDKLTRFFKIFCATPGVTVSPKLFHTPRIEKKNFYGTEPKIVVVVILFFKGFGMKMTFFIPKTHCLKSGSLLSK